MEKIAAYLVNEVDHGVKFVRRINPVRPSSLIAKDFLYGTQAGQLIQMRLISRVNP